MNVMTHVIALEAGQSSLAHLSLIITPVINDFPSDVHDCVLKQEVSSDEGVVKGRFHFIHRLWPFSDVQ